MERPHEFIKVKTRVELRLLSGLFNSRVKEPATVLFTTHPETAAFVYAPFPWKKVRELIESDGFRKHAGPGASRHAYKQLIDDIESIDPDKNYSYYMVTQ